MRMTENKSVRLSDKVRRDRISCLLLVLALFVVDGHFYIRSLAAGEESAAQPGKKEAGSSNAAGVVPLNQSGTVLLDRQNKTVLLKTTVVLRQGALEMLMCKKQTKEHESILSIDAQAYVIHTGLLAVGAKPGAPFRIDTEFHPPTGQKIDIFLNWTDDKGEKHRVPAKSWVRHSINRFWIEKMDALPKDVNLPKNSELKYDNKLKELMWYGPMSMKQRDEFLALSKDAKFRKVIESFYKQSQPREMEADWVFAGSGFTVDENTGTKYYQAEEGDLICVANFGGAMLDLSIASSDSDGDRSFEAYTDRIPPKETEVLVELIPVPEKPKEAAKDKSKPEDKKSATSK